MEPDNRQQMDNKKWYACALASRQVSVLVEALMHDRDPGHDF